MKFLNELKEGERFEGELLITNVLKGISNNGSPYLSITVQDRTGSLEAKKWDASEQDVAVAKIGTIVAVQGDVIEYRGFLQMKVIAMSEISQEKVDYTRFCVSAPVATEELERKLLRYIDSIAIEDCKKIVKRIVENHYEAFLSFPAAARNHHEYASGLLHHTVSMLDLASMLASYYPNINASLLISGVILHDIGKTVELSGPIATKYTLEGKLLGHISLMVSEIRSTADALSMHSEIPLLLEHMILSHHGEKEYGSPVPPLIREAFVLHMIDDFDAKMNIIDKALDGVSNGEFSTRVPAMDGCCFYQWKK